MDPTLPFFIIAGIVALAFATDSVPDMWKAWLEARERRKIAAPEPPRLLPPPEIDEEDAALMDAEWAHFILSGTWEQLPRHRQMISTPDGDYRPWYIYPRRLQVEHKTGPGPGQLIDELGTPPAEGPNPEDACLWFRGRLSHPYGEKCSYSEFRARYPDMDPLALLQERLETHNRRQGLRKAADEAIGTKDT